MTTTCDCPDTIPLCWSYRGPDDAHGIDIPRGPHIHCDVFSTNEHSKAITPCLVRTPTYCDEVFTENATYIFTVMITADELAPHEIRLRVKWTGVWDKFEVTKEN